MEPFSCLVQQHVDLSIILASMVPAILLSLGATLLSRAQEIDLGLDQQCFFVTGIQVCLTKVFSPWIAILLSGAILASLQSAKMHFNRRYCRRALIANTITISMITSIAAGLMYFGSTFAIIYLVDLNAQNVPYPRWTSENFMAILALILIGILWLADRFIGPAQQSKFPVGPIGQPFAEFLSMPVCVLPAALVTTAAATLLALHANTVTIAFTNGFGIMAATTTIVAYGNIS